MSVGQFEDPAICPFMPFCIYISILHRTRSGDAGDGGWQGIGNLYLWPTRTEPYQIDDLISPEGT